MNAAHPDMQRNRVFAKSECADANPRTFGFLKATYANAIEFTDAPPAQRGLLLTIAIIGSVTFLVFDTWAITGLLDPATVDVFDAVMAALFSLLPALALCVLIFSARVELFRPEDQPVLFDRQHRKVYRLARSVPVGLSALIKPWPLTCTTFDWDDLTVVHVAPLSTTGSTITRHHHLVFSAKSPSANPQHLQDEFTFGNHLILGETTIAPLWEHIRRFMEEGGPHLPEDDVLADMRSPTSWKQSMKSIAPHGPDLSFLSWIKKEWPFAILLITLSPIVLPIYLIWGTCNWLSHKTSKPAQWPHRVLVAVGNATTPRHS